jgi:hypothetical protein
VTSPFAGVDVSGHLSKHHTFSTLPNGQLSYYFTGIVIAAFHAAGQDWTHDTVNIDRDIPGLPAGKGLTLRFWAPIVTLSSIANDNTATNAGWAVDEFSVPDTQARRSLRITAKLAVRDADGFILRLGYAAHVIGELADVPHPG